MILAYIAQLENGSFEGWNDEQINAYLTALTSVKEKIKEIQHTCKYASFTVNNLNEIENKLQAWSNYTIINIQRHVESHSYEVFIKNVENKTD